MAGRQPLEEVVDRFARVRDEDHCDGYGIASHRDEVVTQQVNRAVNITTRRGGDDVHVVALPPGEVPRRADWKPVLECGQVDGRNRVLGIGDGGLA
jgi:hypothetical protein